jgi:hypothetical protein
MRIDCDECVMQHTHACDDCIVTAILGVEERQVDLADVESIALRNLADGGVVSPLRLVVRGDDTGAASA